MKNVDESDDGAANGDDHVDNCENDADENVDDGLSVEVYLLRHRPVEVGVHKDDRQLHKRDFSSVFTSTSCFITMLDNW